MKISRETLIENIKKGISFEGADLKGLDLKGADLRGGIFTGANFRYTDLRESNLDGSDLRNANLRHVVLNGSNLSRADLRGADLTHADLRSCILVGAKLDGAKIEGARGVSEKVFFTQKMLDALNEQQKIDIRGNTLTILTGSKPTYSVVSAFRFIIVEGGGQDAHHLLGKVKTEQELNVLKAEVYRDSAIIGDVAYRVEPGFIGVPVRDTAPPAPLHETQPAQPLTSQADAKKADEDLLAEFFLKNL